MEETLEIRETLAILHREMEDNGGMTASYMSVGISFRLLSYNMT